MAGRNNSYRHANTCAKTGKRGYLDRGTARRNRRAVQKRTGERASDVNIYRCHHCDLFHLGHATSSDDRRPRQGEHR